jgi:hypothetical protein
LGSIVSETRGDKIIGQVFGFDRCFRPGSGWKGWINLFPGVFKLESRYSSFFSLEPLVGISAFYVSFKYYHAPVHAQLNRNATSILRQMQSKHRDQEPNERYAQERKSCGQGRMPKLRNLSLPNRKGLAVSRNFALSPSHVFRTSRLFRRTF